VQVLDIEDIGTSLWSQIEAIERVERGEAIHGREIVRTIAVGEDPEASENNRANNNPANGAASASGNEWVWAAPADSSGCSRDYGCGC
jgi:hypothetical protein